MALVHEMRQSTPMIRNCQLLNLEARSSVCLCVCVCLNSCCKTERDARECFCHGKALAIHQTLRGQGHHGQRSLEARTNACSARESLPICIPLAGMFRRFGHNRLCLPVCTICDTQCALASLHDHLKQHWLHCSHELGLALCLLHA